jgi:hypothetical protein
MQALAGSTLLALWERGATLHPIDRCVLLAAAARPDWPADEVADQPLGTVNASLLRLREATFGTRIGAHVDCPACGQRLSFDLDTRVLLQPPADAPDPETVAAGRRLRPPSLRDLAAVAGARDATEAAQQLWARCALEAHTSVPDDDTLAGIDGELEAIDPQCDLALALTCPDCGHCASAQLDPGALLWDELSASAQALLADVHRLACAYGWTEDQVLALGPVRRAHYLTLVGRS